MNFFETFPEYSLPSMDAKRTIMGQSYPIYACTHVNHACYSLVHVTFCGRESFFSKTYKNCSTCRNKLYEKNVWEKSNNTYSLSIRVQTTRRRSRGGEMGEFSLPPPSPLFLSPLLSFFSYHLNQALVLLHYYKNSPPFQNPGSAPDHDKPHFNFVFYHNMNVKNGFFRVCAEKCIV